MTSFTGMQIGLSFNSAAFQVPPDASIVSCSVTCLSIAEAALSDKKNTENHLLEFPIGRFALFSTHPYERALPAIEDEPAQ